MKTNQNITGESRLFAIGNALTALSVIQTCDRLWLMADTISCKRGPSSEEVGFSYVAAVWKQGWKVGSGSPPDTFPLLCSFNGTCVGGDIKMHKSKMLSLGLVVPLPHELQTDNGDQNQGGSRVYAPKDRTLPSPRLTVFSLISCHVHSRQVPSWQPGTRAEAAGAPTWEGVHPCTAHREGPTNVFEDP